MPTFIHYSRTAHVIRLIAGIMCLMAILFISLFAFDVFDPALSVLQQIQTFLLHMIPSFILLAMLIFAWKKALTGGIVILLTGLLLSPFVFTHNYQMNHNVWMSLGIIALINLPFVLVGALFIVSAYLQHKSHLPV